jgi:hypothetical protein
MAAQITQSPVQIPTGLRATTGVVNFTGATYAAGGITFTVAQWGGGVNGIPNRFPDFVIFNAGLADDDADTDGATILQYHSKTEGNAVAGGVSKYGDEPLVDQAGLGEGDAAASSAQAKFLAFWVTPDPNATVTL